jgi:hypothetical protein
LSRRYYGPVLLSASVPGQEKYELEGLPYNLLEIIG